MIINDFLYFLQQCKPSQKTTGGFLGVKLYRYIKNTCKIILKKEEVCPRCHTDLSKQEIGIEVIFEKSMESLTIFQAEMLFMVFAMKQKPYDYASYHKCIAGKKFIENIKSIRVLP